MDNNELPSKTPSNDLEIKAFSTSIAKTVEDAAFSSDPYPDTDVAQQIKAAGLTEGSPAAKLAAELIAKQAKSGYNAINDTLNKVR